MRRNVPVHVRPYARGDLAHVDRVVVAAYGRPIFPAIDARLNDAMMHGFVAERAGVVCGFVSVRDYGSTGYIGSMAVDPAAQRLGVGAALMSALIAHSGEHGPASLLLDATDQGAPLYEKFGFEDVDLTYVLTRPSYAGVAAVAERASDDAALARAIAIDRELLGCDRDGSLRILAREANARVVVGDGAYAIAREHVLGPWLAATERAARDVFERALVAAPHVVTAFAPRANATGLALAYGAGFTIARSLRHMARGPARFPRAHTIFAQASLAHG